MGRILAFSLLAPLALPRNESLEIESRRRLARFALFKRSAQRRQPCFLFFEQSQTGTNNIAGRAIAALLHLLIDEIAEVLAEAEGCVLGNDRLRIPIFGIRPI